MMKATIMCATVLGLATQASAFGGDELHMEDDDTVMSVINGQTKVASEAPWFAVMIAGSDGMQNMCGGAHIGNGWIITAAHCVGFDAAHVEHKGDQWHIGANAVVSGQNWWESGWDGARMAPNTSFGSAGWFLHPEYVWSHPEHLGADPVHDTKDQYDCGPGFGDAGWSTNMGGFHDFGGDCEQWDMALVRVDPIDSYQGNSWQNNVIEIYTEDVCDGDVTLWGTGRTYTSDKTQRTVVEKAVLNVYTPEECFNSVWNLNFIGSGTGTECQEQADYFQNGGSNLLCGNQALRNNDWLGSVICAGGKSPVDGVVRSSCNGDSGGPITRDVNGTQKLVGMVNSGNVNDCENDEASLYFRLSMGKALQWVSSTINGNGGSIDLGAMNGAGLCTGTGGSATAPAPVPLPPVEEAPAAPVTEAAVEVVVEAVEAVEEAEVAVETAAGACASAQLKDSYGDGWNGGKITCENGDHNAEGSLSVATLCGECNFAFTQPGSMYPAEASVECGGSTYQAAAGGSFSCGAGTPVAAPVVEAVEEAVEEAVVAEEAAEEAAEEVGVVLEATASACGTATMVDSYGDGWNGGKMTCGGVDLSLASGPSQDVSVCGECTFTFGSGQYPSEASVTCGGSSHAVSGGAFTCPGVSIPAVGSVDQGAIDAAAAAEAAAAAAEAAAAVAAANAVAEAVAAAAAAQAANDAAAAAAANSAAVAAAAAAAQEAAAAVAAAAAANTAAQVSEGASCTASLKDSYGDGWNGGSMNCMGNTFSLQGGSAMDVTVTCGTSCSWQFGSGQYPSEASVTCSNGNFGGATSGSFTCGSASAAAAPAVAAAVEAAVEAEVAVEAAVEAEEAAPNSAAAAGASCEADSVSPGAMTGGANYGNCGYYTTKGWCNADSYYSDEQWAAANCCSCL